MAVIKCKMCGGDLVLVEGQSVAECEYCGSRQTVPVADNEKKLTLFARANRLRTACEFDKAAGIYESIVADFPEEAEAYWGLVLCKYGIEYVDDPATGKKIPTCHRSSFDSVMDDSNFEQAMENADEVALRVYRQEAKQIEGIRKGILEVSSSEKPYDIFICYKETDSNGDRTVDSLLAQDIYDALTSRGYRVFFSRITLEDKLGQAYEPYIFAALNSAKIMLAVGTCYEHYNAVWVKNEWSRYLKIIAQDKNKYLIPCYKGLDAYDMPKEFAHLQGQDMGKVGAIADLLRGIEKLIPRQNGNTVVVQEKVVVGNAGGSNKIASLLDRGNMALEDGDWAKADSFFEDVLNNDSKNAQAYIGKTLAQERCRTMDALVRKRRDVYQNVRTEELEIPERTAYISGMVNKFALPGYLEAGYLRTLYDVDRTYDSEVSGRKQQYQDEKNWWVNHKLLSRAEKFATGSVAETFQQEKKHLFSQLNERIRQAEQADAKNIAEMEQEYDAFLAETDAQAGKLHQDAISRREKDYQTWLEQAKTETEPKFLRDLADAFVSLYGYKDSKNLAEHCRKRAADEQAKIDAENNRLCLLAEQKRKAQQKRMKIIVILAAACIVLAVVMTLVVAKVVIPQNQYKQAETLLAEGDIHGAAIAFYAIGDYQDSQERSSELWGKIVSNETICAGDYYSVGQKADGTVVAVGRNLDGMTDVSSWEEIVAISTGTFYTVGLKTDGTVVSTGQNTNGQRNVSDWNDIVTVSAGSSHTIGLRKDGSIISTGNNEDGQCNVSEWTDIVVINAGSFHTVGLKKDGTVVAVGRNENGQCNVSEWTDIVAISAGRDHTVGLKADGTVVAVGDNSAGACDVSDWSDIVAISAGVFHTVGVKKDGTVVATQYGGDAQHNRGQCEVSGWTDIVSVSAAGYHTLGLKSDGSVVAVGNNEFGECEVSGWTNIKLPVITEPQQLAMSTANQEREAQLAGEYAAAEELMNNGETAKAAIAFARLENYRDARERCFELWDDITVRETVDAGRFHTVGLKIDGTVVSTNYTDEDKYNCGQCEVSDWTDIVTISTTEGHTVGLKLDGTVVATKYTGKYYDGQCEVSDWRNIEDISTGHNFTVGLKNDHTVLVTGEVNGASDWTDIVAISAGYDHIVGLKADGTVIAAGDNDYGQCEVSDWQDIVAISAGWYHTVGLKADGSLVAVGSNNYGECNISEWQDIVAISAGHNYTVGLKADATVVATGRNNDGQCNVSSWRDIVAISAELIHTVGLKKDGTVVAVGNSYGNRCNVSGWRHIKLP